ncbi:prenyltransferase/squalene oxidase repeat-containing protein [Phycisphaera mikurensis]|uniref:Prenyltransferase n=1 Tax=Phycisphaera mikurensis (strain NBRC 102666 / KCTC 22515 / FYK2301M01) TaxID=1142394 RepID=I0IBQ9_PHYMF|nr:prenyltransferase/squalene oxidase repeat-containing protein [Phycisphaera mikurensis]MBB6443393.1 hypothetical protein [Phycisphaera mikurensis]BAM02697.1 hypothetical protein PSMK_05380 [Phycisphaera mikurensis NBRC 102666]
MNPRTVAHFIVVLAWSAAPALAQPAADAPAAIEADARTAPAVARGLAFLAGVQQPGGGFPDGGQGESTGITGIAGLAFLADGHLPGRTGYGFVVENAAAFILDNAGPSGLIAADTSHGPMYGHGYATLFLAELIGQLGEPAGRVDEARLRAVLARAVRLIVDTQNPEGGWRYQPRPLDADISVTITQIMALRAARNAGLAVPVQTIERAIAYVKACQEDGPLNQGGGGFRYMTSPGSAAWPRSAAGVASLQYAGVYGGDEVERGLAYLAAFTPRGGGNGGFGGGQPHWFYGHYYHAQAVFLAGGSHWTNYFPDAREQMLADQQGDGSWRSSHGEAYATGMALLVLQMPNRLLPIFQR